MSAIFVDDILRCIFLNEKFCILVKISLKFVSRGPIDNKPNIGSNNGLVPKRRQAIIWTNADPINRRIYPALGGDELIFPYTIFAPSSGYRTMVYCRLFNNLIVLHCYEFIVLLAYV